jgi:hypothetical protein
MMTYKKALEGIVERKAEAWINEHYRYTYNIVLTVKTELRASNQYIYWDAEVEAYGFDGISRFFPDEFIVQGYVSCTGWVNIEKALTGVEADRYKRHREWDKKYGKKGA